MKQLNSILSTLGLSEKEITIYLAALKHKKSGPTALAKTVKMPRSTVYDLMLNLVLKGFVTLREAKKGERPLTWIEPKPAAVLLKMIADEQKVLAQAKADLTKLLPLLKQG